MTDTAPTPGTAPVTDNRPVPPGVLPRRAQTFVIVGLAVGVLLIALLAGRPEPPPRPASTPAPATQPSTDRVRDYQDRLRLLQSRSVPDAEPHADTRPAASNEPRTPPPQDPIAADRKRREYESLFASNVVLSRRPADERPEGQSVARAARTDASRGERHAADVDEIADAVVRATLRAGGPPAASVVPPVSAGVRTAPTDVGAAATPPDGPASTPAIGAAGPLHRVLEGTVIDSVLTNRLDGSTAAPVACLVTNPLYSHSGAHVLVPAGARVLGETKPVRAYGETRLAVSFHRLLMPDGRTYRLDQFLGLNQIGDAGLRDQVNHHYLSTFGAAVGLVSGLTQYLSTAGFGRGDGDRTVVIAGGAADATAQATAHVMQRFLNRLPTVTIREGHRVKVYLTSDLELPAYEPMDVARPD
jgi:type IV secretory pathway VirB10-like protein